MSFVSDYSDCQDFEGYSNGNIYPQGYPPFNLFSGASNEQASVTTSLAHTGSRSLRFGNTSDIVYEIYRDIAMVTRLEWMTYIPSGRGGTVGLMTIGPNFALRVEYNNGSATVFSSGVQVASFTYVANTWFKSTLIAFPGDDRIEFWQNGQLRHTVTNFTSDYLAYLNMYYNPSGQTDFYIDDICYRERFQGVVTCSPTYDPVCVNGVEFSNACYAADAGYSECEWTEGACSSGGDCTACDDCFFFLPRAQSPNIIDFQNLYCDDPFLQYGDNRGVYTYAWSVQGGAVQYTGGTNSASENPSMIFPGPGSYTVCQQIYWSGELVFECCLPVIIGGCTSPPVAFYTATYQPFNSVFVLSAGGTGGNLQWTFSDPDVWFWSGNASSPDPAIVLPAGRCVSVCLHVTNGCGTSTYTMVLCSDNAGCPGTTPPLYITGPIEPDIEDLTVAFDLPNPPGGTATYQWDFGDGTTATTQDVLHTYPEGGNYVVCVVITIGCRTWCYCWTVRVSPCEILQDYHDGLLEMEFTGSETNLQYTFTASEPKAPGESWLIDGEPVSGNASTLVYTFPAPGNYVICFPYIGNDGCVRYTCIEVAVGNPFLCNTITWSYSAASGYRFMIPGNPSDILWTIDETNQVIGQGPTSQWVLPVNPCGWRTISVRYFDGVRFRVCCLRIYLCAPTDCESSISYGYLSGTQQATFGLSSAGATDITWYFDDAPAQTLGTTAQIQIPYPGTCVSRVISVRYKDASGRWRVCCRQIYFCNPLACDRIRIHYTPGSGYSFSVTEALQGMSWILEETGTSLGTGLTSAFVATGATCDYRTVSLRYFVPGLGWQLCCLRFYWCDPNACGDEISVGVTNNLITLSTDSRFQQIGWYTGNTFLGAGNPQATNLSSSATHTICLRYLDPCDRTWRWCCLNYTPGGSSSSLTFTLEEQVCGDAGTVVDIPLTARGFNALRNFQFSLQVADTTRGKLVAIERVNLPGDFTSNVIDAQRAGVFWESPTDVTLPDHTVLAKIKVRITASVNGQTALRIVGTPIEIYAENGAGTALTPALEHGSFCYVKLVDICGKITREDQLPIANVEVFLSGCTSFMTTTDASGNYCFRDVPAGSAYTVSARKDVNDKNGVNAGDLSAIKRHILTIERLNSPYKILAGDAKRDQRVNAGDVSELRRLILGQLAELPTTTSWVFTDKKFTFPVPLDPFSADWAEAVNLPSVEADLANVDLIGWKVGDVNLSNNPAALTDEAVYARTAGDIYLYASSVHLATPGTFRIDVTTADFDAIRAAQFSMSWDKAKFHLDSVGGEHPALGLGADNFFIDQPNGRLAFVWDDAMPVTLPDQAMMFSLFFTANVSQTPSSAIAFGQEPVAYYFENGNGEELNVISADGSATVPVREIVPQSWIVYPNPTHGTIRLQGLSTPAAVVEIIDGRGSIVFRAVNVDGQTEIDLAHLATGVYTIRVVEGQNVHADRFFLIR